MSIIYSLLVILTFLVISISSLTLLATLGPVDEEKILKVNKEKFFIGLANQLYAENKHTPHPDYLILTIANPFDEHLSVTDSFLLDTGSDFYTISQETFAKLDLVDIGVCDITHFASSA